MFGVLWLPRAGKPFESSAGLKLVDQSHILSFKAFETQTIAAGWPPRLFKISSQELRTHSAQTFEPKIALQELRVDSPQGQSCRKAARMAFEGAHKSSGVAACGALATQDALARAAGRQPAEPLRPKTGLQELRVGRVSSPRGL